MTWQAGDAAITVNGNDIPIRLTMGALAELDARLGVSGPEALAEKFRALNHTDAKQILASLVTDRTRIGDILMITDTDLRGALPIMCRMFEEAFT